MSWQIRIPHHSPDEPIADIGDLTRGLPGEERAIVRQLALMAAEDGAKTVGHLLDLPRSDPRPNVASCSIGLLLSRGSRSAAPHESGGRRRP